MARKSRKNAVSPEPVKKPAEKVWHAALYIRLSVEFNSNRGDSLETQRQIMEAYIALAPDIEIVEIYTDNGTTGRTFEREAFQRMLNDVEAGKIDCIVVKDLSRLGRNTIDTGYYIEKYFPLHHVRFIAVNDQYDSENAENSGSHLIVPLKNMINEAYAADISKKVRAQQQQAMRAGEFVGARPPYGYKKAPDNCHKLLVNEETAPIVQQIFQWAADGVSLNEMTKRLNNAGVISPGHYLSHAGYTKKAWIVGKGKWQTRSITRILTDEVYLGDMVQGKTKAVGHRQVPTAPEEWIVVRGTHTPLVSRELFEQALASRRQAAAKASAMAEKIPYTANILRGHIYCGCCGRHMNRKRNKQGEYYFGCIANERIGKDACVGGATYVKEKPLFDTIVTIIRQKAEALLGKNLYLKQCDSKIAAQKAETDREISALQQETEKNRAFLAGLYENFVSGVLTRAEYLEMKESYSQKIHGALERTQQLQTRQQALEDQAAQYVSLADRLASVGENAVLTAELTEQLIERVTVDSADDIIIQFRFENDFDTLREVLRYE